MVGRGKLLLMPTFRHFSWLLQGKIYKLSERTYFYSNRKMQLVSVVAFGVRPCTCRLDRQTDWADKHVTCVSASTTRAGNIESCVHTVVTSSVNKN